MDEVVELLGELAKMEHAGDIPAPRVRKVALMALNRINDLERECSYYLESVVKAGEIKGASER